MKTSVKRLPVLIILLIVSLTLQTCNSGHEYAAVSGHISLCNNSNCRKPLDANLTVYTKRLPSISVHQTLSAWLFQLKDNVRTSERALDSLEVWFLRQLEDSLEYQEKNLRPYSVFVDGQLSCDTSKLCGNCTDLYRKLGIPLSTRPKVVNLRSAGFNSSDDVKSFIARHLGFKSLKISEAKSIDERSCRSACYDALNAITEDGVTRQAAVTIAEKSFRESQAFYSSRKEDFDAANSPNDSWQSKDPDQMTDAEWYEYMESLSDDPLWKETVREQRKAKGVD